jgi:putative Mg2+ transporter-C (MgtC) family protein
MISWEEILLRLSLAALLGAAVGIERERKDWAAGLRTHMMVCTGSALTMIVSAFGFHDILGTPNVVLDPSRIAAQVISGIGFIGAGTILFLRQEVIRGLTTAAGLWTVAAIGLATGGGLYLAAGVATAIVLVILWLLKPVERRLFRRYRIHLIRMEVDRDVEGGLTDTIRQLLATRQLELQNLSLENHKQHLVVSFRFRNSGDPNRIITLIESLRNLPGIKSINWDKGN